MIFFGTVSLKKAEGRYPPNQRYGDGLTRGARNFDSIEKIRSQDETYQDIVVEVDSAMAVSSWRTCENKIINRLSPRYALIIHRQGFMRVTVRMPNESDVSNL